MKARIIGTIIFIILFILYSILLFRRGYKRGEKKEFLRGKSFVDGILRLLELGTHNCDEKEKEKENDGKES